jgi:putative transposase
MINGERGWLWRAVDDAGEVLDILVQRRRNALAAKRFFRKLLKGLRMVPCAIVTDRLASYAVAKAVVMPTVSHRRGWRQNNRVENSHQPVRQRERRLQRFKSLRHAARFCVVFSTVCNQFRLGRHALSARNDRTVMRQAGGNGTLSRRRRRLLRLREVSAETPEGRGHVSSTSGA